MKLKIVFGFLFALVTFISTPKDTNAAYTNGKGYAKISPASAAPTRRVIINFHDFTNPGGSLIVNGVISATDGGTPITLCPCTGVSTITRNLTSDGPWTINILAGASGFSSVVRPNLVSATYPTNQQRTLDVYLVPSANAATITPSFAAPLPNSTTAPTPWFNFDPPFTNLIAQFGAATTANVKVKDAFVYTSASGGISPSGNIAIPAQPVTNGSIVQYTAAAFDTNSLNSGTSESSITFGKDTTAPPTPVCSLAVDAPSTLRTIPSGGPTLYTTDETVSVTLTSSDPESGLKRGDINMALFNHTSGGSANDALLPNGGFLDTSDSNPLFQNPGSFSFIYNVNTSPNGNPPTGFPGPRRPHQFFYKTYNNTYNSSGVQAQVSASGSCSVFAVADHVDLEVIDVKLYRDVGRTDLINPSSTLYEGQEVYPKVTFRNNNSTNSIAGPFKVSFYINSLNPTSGSPTPTLISGDYTNVGPNAIVEVWGAGDATSVTVPNGVLQINPNAWIDYLDVVVEDDDTDNYFNPSPGYGVIIPGWIKTTGGDVATPGTFSVSRTPPAAQFLSQYLLLHSAPTTQSYSSQNGWRIGGYNQNLYPQVGGPYTSSLFNHFMPKIQDSIAGDYTPVCDYCYRVHRELCEQHAPSSNYAFGELVYTYWFQYGPQVLRCDNNINPGNHETWSDDGVTPAQPNGNHVYIIGGNLTLDGNFNCCRNIITPINECTPLDGGCLNIFIVKGDLNVSTAASQIDGVFIVNGVFRDYNPPENPITPNALTVNGAVYANSMDLGRKLSTGSSTTPALTVNFDPRLYLFFQEVCGEDTSSGLLHTCYSLGGRKVDWKEISP